MNRLVVLVVIALVLGCVSSHVFVRRRIDARSVTDASQMERDIQTCDEIAVDTINKTKTPMGTDGTQFMLAVVDQCLLNRGYQLRACEPTTLDPFACSGPGEVERGTHLTWGEVLSGHDGSSEDMLKRQEDDSAPRPGSE